MLNQALTIPFVPGPPVLEGDGPWLNLEQQYIPESSQTANLQDITAMWHIALSGSSAIDYIAERCPVTILGGVVTVYLGVYVFPSAQDLVYQISISNGFFLPLIVKPLYREFDLIFPQSDSVTLYFVPDDDITFDWQTEAYNALGERIERPEITVEKNIVKSSVPCFAVLRLKCTTLAHYYPIEIEVVKAGVVVDTDAEAEKKQKCVDACDALHGAGSTDPNYNLYLICQRECDAVALTNKPPDRTGYKVTNLVSTVQATWQGLEKLESKSLALKIPECVKHLLELCDDKTPKSSLINQDTGESQVVHTVYFSTCTGNILDVQYETVKDKSNRHKRKTT